MPFVIDIDPVAFSVLGIQVRWYGLILVLAISVAVWIAQREAGRRGISSKDVSDGTIWVGGAALIGGRLLFVVQNDLPALADHPAHILMVWMGGLSFYGGLVGGRSRWRSSPGGAGCPSWLSWTWRRRLRRSARPSDMSAA